MVGPPFRRHTLRRCLPLAAALLAVPLALALPAPAVAQFDGSFAIERHRLSEENWLDFRSYQPLFPDRDAWYAAASGLRGSVGSLSISRFYTFREIKLEKDFAPWFTFRYSERAEALVGPEPAWREVAFRFGTDAHVSVVGWPEHQKKLGAQGLAVGLGEPDGPTWVRYSQVFQFALFNDPDRNDTTQRFEISPRFHRLEVRRQRGPLFVDLEAVRESPTRLHTPDAQKRESYEGRRLRLRIEWHAASGLRTGVNVVGHREQREREPDGPGSPVSAAAQNLRWGWAEVYAAARLAGGDVVEGGLFRGVLDDRIRADDPAEAYEHRTDTDMAYVFWNHRVNEWRSWRFGLLAGSVELFQTAGQTAAGRRDERTFQAKLATALQLAEAGSYRFLAQPTWDLDGAAERLWDGGNVQIELYF